VLAVVIVLPICILQLSWTVRVASVLVAGAVASFDFWRAGWLGGKRRLTRAIWTGEGEWRLVDRAGAAWLAHLSSASQVMGAVIWLRFTSDRGSRALLFCGSDLPVDVRRRLTARLRAQALKRDPEVAELKLD
jgi:hypothetical protein